LVVTSLEAVSRSVRGVQISGVVGCEEFALDD
jgi:hypothetical protein